MIEGRPTKNMQEKAIATLCFTYTSLHNHCEKNQNTRRTYPMWRKMTNYVNTHDQLEEVVGIAFNQ
jgi:cAMP phosphodiesterase